MGGTFNAEFGTQSEVLGESKLVRGYRSPPFVREKGIGHLSLALKEQHEFPLQPGLFLRTEGAEHNYPYPYGEGFPSGKGLSLISRLVEA